MRPFMSGRSTEENVPLSEPQSSRSNELPATGVKLFVNDTCSVPPAVKSPLTMALPKLLGDAKSNPRVPLGSAIDSAAKCWGPVKVTTPPLTATVKGESATEPASLWNVAEPAVLVNVAPGDQLCVPAKMAVPLLVKFP